MTFKATALATLLSTASATTCQSLCESLESCASDPNAKGSYCKTDESPQACFGLYYMDASLTAMCFQPNDTECSETYPVICPEAPKALTCQDVCKDVETCREDPQAHGSYCKFEETNPICFGLYYENEAMETICFEPNDSNCIESNPVPCPTDEVEKHEAEIRANALGQSNTCQEICETVDSCREDPHAHGSYCKFEETNPFCFGLYYENESETTICFQPNDPACAELNPVSCPPVEVAKQMSTKKANDDKPAPRSCQDICNDLQSCREDPNTHGSYCKVDGSQQTCFGLYHTNESKTDICFQPNDMDCQDTFPVDCPADEVAKVVLASASDTKVTQVELFCQDLCQNIPACREDPKAHGSYCKTWLPTPVCFGFYYTTASKETVCFEPNDPSCPEKYPVTCIPN